MTRAVPPGGWTCFHCEETFLDEHSAQMHFGYDDRSEPACLIKAGAERSMLEALRRLEAENTRLREDLSQENTESAKAYWSQQARHQNQLRVVEELGYQRGLEDSRRERQTDEEGIEHG